MVQTNANNMTPAAHLPRASALVILTTVLLQLAFSPVLADEKPDPMTAIVRDWDARRLAFSNVKYTINGTTTFPKGGCTDPYDKSAHPKVRLGFPESDVSIPYDGEFLFDFGEGKVRRFTNAGAVSLTTAEITRRAEYLFYDAKATYTVTPKDQPFRAVPSYLDGAQIETTPGRAPQLLLADHLVMLHAHGIITGGTTPPGLDKVKSQRPDIGLRYVGLGEIGNRKCVVLQTPGPQIIDELWVDPSAQSAVLRWKMTVRGNLKCQYDCTYRQYDDGWYPASWRYMSFGTGAKDQVRQIDEIRVLKLEKNIATTNEEFTPKYQPKDLVVDVNTMEQKVVLDDGTLAPRNRATLFWSWRMWVMLLAAILIVVAVSVYLLRAMRRKPVTQ